MNATAQVFKALHKPGQPLILANVCDILTARTVAALPSCKALATASYGIAQANGTSDDDMQLETNLTAVRGIAKVAEQFHKPLSADIQDAYGEKLEEAIASLIDYGVVGVNLEDCDKERQRMHSKEVAVERIRRALRVAEQRGVPDFVINARCDTLIHGGGLEEVVERGEAYLAAGATCVFVWGGSKRGLARHEVVQLVEAFSGRLSVAYLISGEGLGVKDLAEIGVCRLSIGPSLQFIAMEATKSAAEKLLGSL